MWQILPHETRMADLCHMKPLQKNQGKRDASAAAVFGIVRDAEGYACLSNELVSSHFFFLPHGFFVSHVFPFLPNVSHKLNRHASGSIVRNAAVLCIISPRFHHSACSRPDCLALVVGLSASMVQPYPVTCASCARRRARHCAERMLPLHRIQPPQQTVQALET